MFCNKYDFPNEFSTDNGREFVNKAISEYALENNIILIRGSPYNPKSQGCVERMHSTIRKALLSKFVSDPNNFNLEESLNEVMINYNKCIHSTTNHTPNVVFYSTSSDLYNEVIKNTLDRFNNIRKLGYNFAVNEKCLLSSNFIKTNQKNKEGFYYLIKNKVKKNKTFYYY